MPKVITVQEFTKDLWEVQRKEIFRELGKSVDTDVLEKNFPSWEQLDEKTKQEKMRSINKDLLRTLYQAGYEVRVRDNGNGPRVKRTAS